MEIQVHGALVEVLEVGVLLMGRSGVGKSECALELIQRGHRLVADDVVRLRNVERDEDVAEAREGGEGSQENSSGRSPTGEPELLLENRNL